MIGLNALPGFVVFIISAFLFVAAIMSLFIPFWICRIKNEFIRLNTAVVPCSKTHVVCPDCKEFVRIGAVVCKHCGCKFAETEQTRR